MGPRTLLVATGAALAMAGAGACGAAGSHASHAAAPAHSASASPSQRSTSQTSQSVGTTAQTGAGSSGSTATGTSSTATGTGVTGSGQDETVGIWPVSTRAQAIQLQQSVNAGHQPWLLDPTQVVDNYVMSEWHVSQAPVKRIGPTQYRAQLAPTSYTIIRVGQPVHPGPGGIWVIVLTTQYRS